MQPSTLRRLQTRSLASPAAKNPASKKEMTEEERANAELVAKVKAWGGMGRRRQVAQKQDLLSPAQKVAISIDKSREAASLSPLQKAVLSSTKSSSPSPSKSPPGGGMNSSKGFEAFKKASEKDEETGLDSDLYRMQSDVARLHEKPLNGQEEIIRAFDEIWISMRPLVQEIFNLVAKRGGVESYKISKASLLKVYPRDRMLLEKLDEDGRAYYWMSDWEAFIRGMWEPLGRQQGGQGLKTMLIAMLNRLKILKEVEGVYHSA